MGMAKAEGGGRKWRGRWKKDTEGESSCHPGTRLRFPCLSSTSAFRLPPSAFWIAPCQRVGTRLRSLSARVPTATRVASCPYGPVEPVDRRANHPANASHRAVGCHRGIGGSAGEGGQGPAGGPRRGAPRPQPARGDDEHGHRVRDRHPARLQRPGDGGGRGVRPVAGRASSSIRWTTRRSSSWCSSWCRATSSRCTCGPWRRLPSCSTTGPCARPWPPPDSAEKILAIFKSRGAGK